MKKLPTLSDGKPRFVSKERHAELARRAQAAGVSLAEFLEFGGAHATSTTPKQDTPSLTNGANGSVNRTKGSLPFKLKPRLLGFPDKWGILLYL